MCSDVVGTEARFIFHINKLHGLVGWCEVNVAGSDDVLVVGREIFVLKFEINIFVGSVLNRASDTNGASSVV